jgi:ketosteroid isomerase-like protein
MSPDRDRAEIARATYRAFAAGEREVVEELFVPEFRFHSPPDPDLDRAGYFERCWPGAGNGTEFEFVRTIESGEELVVTYEASRVDGSRFRNTEVLTFDGERIARVEVYFGWDLD